MVVNLEGFISLSLSVEFCLLFGVCSSVFGAGLRNGNFRLEIREGRLKMCDVASPRDAVSVEKIQ